MKRFLIGFGAFAIVAVALGSVPFVAKAILGPRSKLANYLLLLLLLAPVAGLYASVVATRGGELWERWLASSLRPSGGAAVACLLGGIPLAVACLAGAVALSQTLGVAVLGMFLPFAGAVVLSLCGLGGLAAQAVEPA